MKKVINSVEKRKEFNKTSLHTSLVPITGPVKAQELKVTMGAIKPPPPPQQLEKRVSSRRDSNRPLSEQETKETTLQPPKEEIYNNKMTQ
jgi:hypothetical protein